jgi:hypothetical protein
MSCLCCSNPSKIGDWLETVEHFVKILFVPVVAQTKPQIKTHGSCISPEILLRFVVLSNVVMTKFRIETDRYNKILDHLQFIISK